MKKVNNFQMAKSQLTPECCIAFSSLFANFSLMLLIKVLLIKKTSKSIRMRKHNSSKNFKIFKIKGCIKCF